MSTFAGVIPTGTVDSTNTLFTISLNTNSLTSFEFYKNGVLQSENTDYTWTQTSGTATITTSTPPDTGDSLNSWLWQQ